MTLEIVHTERAYIVVDNERGYWTSQWIYNSYLNARKFALAWKAAAKYWRLHYRSASEDYWNLREATTK